MRLSDLAGSFYPSIMSDSLCSVCHESGFEGLVMRAAVMAMLCYYYIAGKSEN